MLSRTFRTAALVSLLALSCTTGQDDTSRRAANAAPEPFEVVGSVAHRDPRLGGAPSFVWFNRSTDLSFASAEGAAVGMLPTVSRAFGVREGTSVELAHVDDLGKGPILARYTQRVGDLEVFRAGVSVMFTRERRPVAASGFLAPAPRGSERPFVLAPTDVLAIGARLVGISTGFTSAGERDGYARFTAPGLFAPARVKKVLQPVPGAEGVELEPAYYVELMTAHGPARGLVLSAEDGRVLLENDLVHADAYTYRVFADPTTKLPTDGPQGNGFNPHPTGVPDGTKLQFEPSKQVTLQNFPFSRNDPWLAPGATTTNGNNVWAYADTGGNDGFDVGSDTAPQADAGVFDDTYDTSASPSATPASIRAASTQLFYVTNFLHDWFYDAGFDEKSRNHQKDNLGRGGRGNDPLFAEAQDFSGRNNANALVPPDGSSPRIQMFIFSGASQASLEVTAPAGLAGKKNTGIASGFGKDVFDVTGTVVLASDGAGADPSDACEALENDVAGKIVLAHRGTCSFAQKAANGQAAGAIGVIIANVSSSANPTIAPFMGGQQNGITVPVLSLNQADGEALEKASTPATVQMKRSAGSDLDGALDTSIVAHEWGHVLSSRLVGDGMGLTTNQSGGLGEGWGDFTALLLMARPDDPGEYGGVYTNGSYATSGSGPDIYFGTRRVPYSIDFKKNALTLKHIANGNALPTGVPTSFGEDGSFNSEVHSTGEVWATLLWECYATLLREGRYSFDEAQDRMKRYLVASLKLTPVDPTIIEARDAVLAAALAADENDFQLFWKAFARRGAGAGALAPPKDSSTNQGVVESFESGNALQVVSATLTDDRISCDHDGILDEGEVGSITLEVRNSGSGTLQNPRFEVRARSAGLRIVDPEPSTLPPLKPFEAATVKVKVGITGVKPAEVVELEVGVTDPALPESRVITVPLRTRFDADQAADSSAIDHVDTTKTVWKVAGDNSGQKWARSTEDGDGFWMVADNNQKSDQKLTSPPFTIEGTSFTLAFKHKWSLFFSTRRNVAVNGGVVEVSIDGGKTWNDISTYGKVDYTVTLDESSRSDNPLKGRRAYGKANEGYPDAWVSSRIDVNLPEQPASVQVRFRLGTTLARPSDGWFIDDIELVGVSSTPFWSYVPHTDVCDEKGPAVNAGASQVARPASTVRLAGTATHPSNLPLTYIWTQVAGPQVTLNEGATLTPSFQAPDAKEPATLTFSLRAHDGALLSAASKVDVLVDPGGPAAEDASCACRSTPAPSGGWTGAVALLGVVSLLARRSASRKGEPEERPRLD